MICVHCGTLNPEGGGRCVHCGRPPVADAADMCAAHADRLAVARCGICDTSLCEDCQVLVAGSPYCRTHADRLTEVETAKDGIHARPVLNLAEKATATFAQRLGAGVIDLALIGVYVLIIYLVLWSLSGSPPVDPDAGGWRALFWLLVVLGPLGYLCWENADDGQTVGKSVTDLIALRDDGTLMDAQTGALRGLLSALGFLLGGVGFWYILWDPDRRALHDRLLGTVVVCE